MNPERMIMLQLVTLHDWVHVLVSRLKKRQQCFALVLFLRLMSVYFLKYFMK